MGKRNDAGYVAIPESYTRRQLNALYREIPLKDTTSRLLRKYFNAMANLYGIIPLKKAYEIISGQSPTLVTEQELLAFAEIARHEVEDYYILGADEIYTNRAPVEPMRREIIDTLLVEGNMEQYAQTKEIQRGKPYYVPSKKELLLYDDALYCEETPAAAALKKFLATDMHLNEEKAEEVFHGLLYNARCVGAGFQDLMNHLEKLGIRFRSAGDVQKFAGLYQEFHNNTRMQCNRGFTPNEMSSMRPPEQRVPCSMSFGPNLRGVIASGAMDAAELREGVLAMNLPNEKLRASLLGEIAAASDPVKSKKVGRNDLCPCGSGKKFKKCCGR
ncbi:YecA family protein [Pseudoflavonifractor phocaeensis]|uniref:YecA family protein n=1 Tax=Pseudoflavonifractor phocaeensis TaxID=1870988 RepID=UPI001E09FC20|nr:SEC-C metal-binding domain-containing protein [Pseudoflavonifractor phocaeensis]MBM6888066.1 SEC-C domain-containing protein [Pseudoflavonifractor phocaeensis]